MPPPSSAHVRSNSPGRSARSSGPLIVRVALRGAGAVLVSFLIALHMKTGRRARTHRSCTLPELWRAVPILARPPRGVADLEHVARPLADLARDVAHGCGDDAHDAPHVRGARFDRHLDGVLARLQPVEGVAHVLSWLSRRSRQLLGGGLLARLRLIVAATARQRWQRKLDDLTHNAADLPMQRTTVVGDAVAPADRAH